jgi:hypothetical protein
VKKPVLRVLSFQGFHRLDLACVCGAYHVVPAENLMEHNAVSKPAQPQSEYNSRLEQWFHGVVF